MKKIKTKLIMNFKNRKIFFILLLFSLMINSESIANLPNGIEYSTNIVQQSTDNWLLLSDQGGMKIYYEISSCIPGKNFISLKVENTNNSEQNIHFTINVTDDNNVSQSFEINKLINSNSIQKGDCMDFTGRTELFYLLDSTSSNLSVSITIL